RSLAAAGHLPRHLRARPRLQHPAGHVVDLAGRDLAGVARPDHHRPRAALEGGAGAGLGRVALEPRRDLRVRDEELGCLLLRQPALVRLARPGRRGRKQQGQERHAGDESQRRNDQSLLPRKFSGVTTTIAHACATTSPSPKWTSSHSAPRFAKYTVAETAKKRIPWTAKWPRCSRNVQCRFHQ